MQIARLEELTSNQLHEAAHILVVALQHVPSARHDIRSAMAEVSTFVHNPDRAGLAAINNSEILGWIGVIRHSGSAWELHPLVVRPERQRQGYGRRLVSALEDKARQDGVCTIWLGTDDDFGGTNLFGCDLYPDVLVKLQQLRPRAGHPYVFYERLGYAVAGVLPDVDGIGKHDILMAKRISPRRPA